MPFMMIPGALNSMIRADGSPKYAMFSMALGAIINTIFDPVFIFVFHMGVQGAAIATVMGQVASFIVSVAYLPRFKSLRFQASSFRLKSRTCGSILSFGVSGFITQFAITIVMALTNNLLASYGVKNYTRVKKALDIAFVLSEIVSIVAFLIFQFTPMTIVSLFGSEEGLYNEFAVMAFRIFLLLCPLTGFQTVVAVYLQAVGKPIKSAILSLARQIIFFVPAALILPRFLGVTGVLWTGPVADGLAFLLSLGLLLYERSLLKKAEAAA
nr:polysaccharide biosynthesis C-terminal domain-containing protein [Faecalibacterium sp. An192]